MYPVFGKEFYKLGSSVAALSKTFSLDTRKGLSHSVTSHFHLTFAEPIRWVKVRSKYVALH